MAEVRVRVRRVEPHAPAQFLLVLTDDEQRVLPMSIGVCEAVSIQSIMRRGEALPWVDNTHDLLGDLITLLGGRLVKVVVDDLWKKVYFAKLHIAVNGQTMTVDARPSDAVAVALRLGAPLYATDAVMSAANAPEEEPEGDSDEAGLGLGPEGL
jgi:hypothetical protein